MQKIKFGTDGWRGLIGEDFTLARVRHVASAIAQYVRSEGEPARGLIIGFDTRFLSPECARCAAEVVAETGVPVLLADRPTPTPAISYAVVARQAAGAIMVTASHNPYRWNGLKFKAPYGGSAAPEIVRRIEAHLHKSGRTTARPRRIRTKAGPLQTLDLITPYLERLKEIVHLDRIKASGLRFVIDPMFGAGRGCIARLFEQSKIPYQEIHSEHNPLFPGLNPEPIEPHIRDLRQEVGKGRYDAGFATDGDADRVGAVSSDGTFIDSHKIFSILLKHLAEDLKLRGEVAKTFSTTRMIDKLCSRYGFPIHITPIGFKYICELMLTRDVLIGGEESGGIGIRGHLPERDGILNSLLLAEVMAYKDRTLSELVRELSEEVGPHHYGRVDLEIERKAAHRIVRQIAQDRLQAIAGLEVSSVDDLDGVKMFLGDSAWLLVRASGTENVLRLYAEAPSAEQVKALLDATATLARKRAKSEDA